MGAVRCAVLCNVLSDAMCSMMCDALAGGMPHNLLWVDSVLQSAMQYAACPGVC